MKRRKLFTIAGSVCLMVVIAALPFMAACAAPEPTPVPTPTPGEVIRLNFGTFYPILHPMNYDSYSVWCRELDKRTEGRTRTILYGGASLFEPKRQWEALLTNIDDIGDIWPAGFPGVFPVSEMYHLPFIAPGASIASPTIYRMTSTHDEILSEWDKVHVIAQHTSAITNLHSSHKLIKTLEDMDGVALAAEAAQSVKWLEQWGAASVRMDPIEAILGLEKGIIKGGIWPWAPLRSLNLTDYLKYHTVIDLNFVFATIAVNKEKWESLPTDVQDVINEISGINFSALCGYTLDNGSVVDVHWMKDQGHEFYTLPPDEKARWVERIAATVDEWKAKVAGLGVDADKLWDDLHDISAEVQKNPYPEQEWWGRDAVGRYGSPNRPGGWD